MFMVPFVFLLVGVFGIGSSAADQDPQDLARQAGITGIVAKALSSVGDLTSPSESSTSWWSASRLFLATRALLKVLRIVHALVWHTRAGKPRRSWVAVLSLLGIVMLGIALVVADRRAARPVVPPRAGGDAHLRGDPGGPVDRSCRGICPMPRCRGPRCSRARWCSASGSRCMHLVTVYWIAHLVESKTETYGAIGFALVLLLWAYLVGRLITTSAVVNESLWTRHRGAARATAAARGRRRRRRDGAAPKGRPDQINRESGDG